VAEADPGAELDQRDGLFGGSRVDTEECGRTPQQPGITEDGDWVVVRTRESWAGAPIDADRDNLAALDDSLASWLDALKKAAEAAAQ
jgi:hypothetical protein